MESGTRSFGVRKGMEVLDADGQKQGEVKDARGDRLVSHKGWLFPDDHEIPASAIREVDDRAVYLTVTKDAILAGERDPDDMPGTPVLEGVYDPTLALSGADQIGETDTFAATLTEDDTRPRASEADIVEEVVSPSPVLPLQPDEAGRRSDEATVYLIE
ncbi:MAG: DUF2171 domain-containing protein [Thermomicrobiales bacterium]